MPESTSAASLLAPGDFVRNPDRPEWGLGQVQSVVGARITANFENAGKLTIDGTAVTLQRVTLSDERS